MRKTELPFRSFGHEIVEGNAGGAIEMRRLDTVDQFESCSANRYFDDGCDLENGFRCCLCCVSVQRPADKLDRLVIALGRFLQLTDGIEPIRKPMSGSGENGLHESHAARMRVRRDIWLTFGVGQFRT